MIEEKWRSLGTKTSKKFEIGDLVSWKLLGTDKKKDFGIIVEIFKSEEGGRNIVFAKVVQFKDNTTLSLPILSLRRISQREKDEI